MPSTKPGRTAATTLVPQPMYVKNVTGAANSKLTPGGAAQRSYPTYYSPRLMKLSGIFVYPIKACGGIALESAVVAERGLADDRRYMLVDRAGEFITQRSVPRLCLVRPRFGDASSAQRGFELTAPQQSPLELPRELSGSDLEAVPYRVWSSSGSALRHPEGSRWFSEFLNDDVSLVYMPDTEQRAVNPQRARPGDIVSFADGYPMLLISEASLEELNRRLDEPLEMRRFRPNLVISGCAAHAEDGFARLQIGAVAFRGVKRCDRCMVTTIDPDTGQKGKEPLRTLAHYRQEDGKVWFGMNLIHDGSGTLHVGDVVTVHGQ